jgi:CheY-like chemotaxis protein
MTERIKRLLVIDDNTDNREAYARHFQSTGIEVETAADGQEAWNRMLEQEGEPARNDGRAGASVHEK